MLSNVPVIDISRSRTSDEAARRAMGDLAARLMALFALALDLPERFFDGKIDRHISRLRRRCPINSAPARTPIMGR